MMCVQSLHGPHADAADFLVDSAMGLNPSPRTLLQTGANILAIGPPRLLAAFTAACSQELPHAVTQVRGPDALDDSSGRTVLLAEVDALDADGQRLLWTWLNDPVHARTQIVSLASAPLYPLVVSGRFDRDLYYRLNTIYLPLEAASGADAQTKVGLPGARQSHA